MRQSTPESLWANVEKTEKCWNWKGYAARYGFITYQGKRISTHRLAYILTHGEIPDGKIVRHSCDNTLCCNPEHLLLGTQYDNVQDMMRRGRNIKPSGDDHWTAKRKMQTS